MNCEHTLLANLEWRPCSPTMDFTPFSRAAWAISSVVSMRPPAGHSIKKSLPAFIAASTAALWSFAVIDTTIKSMSGSATMLEISWYALTGCPTSLACFSAEADADASERVHTATRSYRWRIEGCVRDGPSILTAHPDVERPMKPTLIGLVDIVCWWNIAVIHILHLFIHFIQRRTDKNIQKCWVFKLVNQRMCNLQYRLGEWQSETCSDLSWRKYRCKQMNTNQQLQLLYLGRSENPLCRQTYQLEYYHLSNFWDTKKCGHSGCGLQGNGSTDNSVSHICNPL